MLERSTSVNYYNPYILYPYTIGTPQVTSGILGKGNFSFSSLLNGAQKTLNFVNQTIPVVKQVTPMVQNAKTMFKLMNEFKKIESPTSSESKDLKTTQPTKNNTAKEENDYNYITNGPTFFI